MELFEFNGRSFYIKRDDLTHPYLSGNKYRKLQTLLGIPSDTYNKIISYGGTQSNAMLALASVAEMKGWQFDYYHRQRDSVIAQQAEKSNFSDAISLGMKPIKISDKAYDAIVDSGYHNLEEKVLFVPQGGASDMAYKGISCLAKEILEFQEKNGLKNITVVTPSGTGTTAYFLARALPNNRVLTTAGVGNNEYLKLQMQKFGVLPKNLILLPSEKKYHFAKPHKDLLAMYQQLKASGIEFDLLYAPKMWLALRSNIDKDEIVLYVHSGGVSGNSSMLARYHRKGWL
ncbi:MAG TPA: pyridoxal-phosphate dependent enzyme [Helicobacteraceae bacterium]|nr:pyridoxal-phosphate dependent enzyme [Helicobacteraceae bacterium]